MTAGHVAPQGFLRYVPPSCLRLTVQPAAISHRDNPNLVAGARNITMQRAILAAGRARVSEITWATYVDDAALFMVDQLRAGDRDPSPSAADEWDTVRRFLVDVADSACPALIVASCQTDLRVLKAAWS
ncbi:MAG: hypothetical protein JWM93_3998 [Frankiales bacterium]|nr:hypothetical protein [Frankiales bacterium]